MTAAAVKRLQNTPEGLTPQSIAAMEHGALVELLRGVGFHRQKAKYLQDTARQLLESSSSSSGGLVDIPADIKGLCALPGVGMKMATICMAVAHNSVTGIGVDTHVHRVADRLGWADAAAGRGTAEDTRKQLEAWLPRPLWGEINLLLVGFGQQICKPKGPLCGGCLNRDLCPDLRRRQRAAGACGEAATTATTATTATVATAVATAAATATVATAAPAVKREPPRVVDMEELHTLVSKHTTRSPHWPVKTEQPDIASAADAVAAAATAQQQRKPRRNLAAAAHGQPLPKRPARTPRVKGAP